MPPDGTPRGLALVSASRPERGVPLELLPEAIGAGEALICDKGYAGAEFAEQVELVGGFVFRPRRRDERGASPHLALIRQPVESVFWACKAILTLERHGARTIEGLCARIGARILTLAACISLSTTGSGVRAALWSTTPPEFEGIDIY